jgi:hypothetical protein
MYCLPVVALTTGNVADIAAVLKVTQHVAVFRWEVCGLSGNHLQVMISTKPWTVRAGKQTRLLQVV